MTDTPEDQPTDAPLAGIRVVEAGRFASAPSCATVLADWGAEVIKLEPPGGDPARAPGSLARSVNPRFDVHNRTRRSVALDLRLPEGRTIADRLLASADVFVTNLRPAALEKLGLAPARQLARNSRLVYGQITGYGLGEAENVASYDHGAFWSASGLAALYADAEGVPPQPTGGLGDRATGTALAGAITAALYRRERTGRGEHVTASLLRTAMWLMASDVADALREPGIGRANDRRRAPVPTLNCFRCADGRWLWLQCMLPDRMWDALLGALDAGWLDDDPRFRSGNRRSLAESGPALVDAFDEIFRQRPLAEWSRRLTAAGIPFAPVRTLDEAVGDRVTDATGAFLDMEHDGTAYRTVNSPCSFGGTGPARPTPSPGVGQDTVEVLAELGVPRSEIDALTEKFR